eukprot:1839316-Amphidinium_carterae.1
MLGNQSCKIIRCSIARLGSIDLAAFRPSYLASAHEAWYLAQPLLWGWGPCASRPPIDELLVYLDAGGRRILGPHFEGVDCFGHHSPCPPPSVTTHTRPAFKEQSHAQKDRLGVCLLSHAERLATFRGAATRHVL